MTYPIDTTSTTGGYTGKSGKYIPEIWSGKLLEKFYAATVFGEIANTDYEGEISDQGDQVNISSLPDITIRDHSINTDLLTEDVNVTTSTLLIDKGKYYNIPISDVETKQSNIKYVSDWATSAAAQTKVAIDKDILANIPAQAATGNYGVTAGADSNVDLGAATTDGSTAVSITKDTVLRVITNCAQVLDDQDIPDDNRWIVLPNWAVNVIRTSDLNDASLTGDATSIIRNGKIGMVGGFMVYKSNQILKTVETAKTCSSVVFGHKSALTFASQMVKNEKIKNPKRFGDIIRGLQVYGYKVVQPTAMGHLYCVQG